MGLFKRILDSDTAPIWAAGITVLVFFVLCLVGIRLLADPTTSVERVRQKIEHCVSAGLSREDCEAAVASRYFGPRR